MEFLKKIFGIRPAVNLKTLVQNGAVIVDVRSKGEYQSGHIPGSMNIPVDVIAGQLSRLPKGKPIITCCASGMRSASAKGILKSNGFEDVYNGGGWLSLQNKIN
jgi:phage shock protein E